MQQYFFNFASNFYIFKGIFTMIKAIFIDIDNTLLDFDAYVKESLKNGFERFGLIKYEDYMYDIFKTENDKLWVQLEKKEIDFETLKKIRFNCIFNKLGIDFDGVIFENYFREQLNESAIPVDGAYNLLNTLSSRYILCTASNGPYMQQINRLTKAGMIDYFDYIFISEKIGHSKPSMEFFDISFSILNEGRLNPITPEECIIIGDSVTSDISGGHNYGMKTCFYSHQKKDVSDSRIDYFVKDLSEICQILQ